MLGRPARSFPGGGGPLIVRAVTARIIGVMADDILKAGYDAVHDAMPRSPTLRAIWRQHASGADFPDDFYHISFVTLPQLRWMSSELRVGDGGTIADVGCGTGGPALWMARETGARVAGIDLSTAAVAQAAAR